MKPGFQCTSFLYKKKKSVNNFQNLRHNQNFKDVRELNAEIRAAIGGVNET